MPYFTAWTIHLDSAAGEQWICGTAAAGTFANFPVDVSKRTVHVSEESAAAAPPKVLIVDDEPGIRSMLGNKLARRGWKTFTARTIAEARLIAEREHPQVAFLDRNLPDGDALDFVPVLRALVPEIAVAMLSADGNEAVRAEAQRVGTALFLEKPLTSREIELALDVCLGRAAARDLPFPKLAQAEDDHVRRALAKANGNISEAARLLGITRTALQNRLKKLLPGDDDDGDDE